MSIFRHQVADAPSPPARPPRPPLVARNSLRLAHHLLALASRPLWWSVLPRYGRHALLSLLYSERAHHEPLDLTLLLGIAAAGTTTPMQLLLVGRTGT
jgi:hypothetical protein